MSPREVMAKLIFATDNSNYKGDMDVLWKQAKVHHTLPGDADAAYAYHIADGLIAAGYKLEGDEA